MHDPNSNLQPLLASVGLDKQTIRRIARQCRFCCRADAKIAPDVFIYTLCQAVCQSSVSCNDLAAAIQVHGGPSVSRQAIALRFKQSCSTFVQALLAVALQAKCPELDDAQVQMSMFGRILVQDSTVVRLPGALRADFSGVGNAHARVCNARVQAVYDLKNGRFNHFSIDSYRRNDQAAAVDLVPEKGDLILRDRGYFDCRHIQAIIDKEADLITRYKHGVSMLEPGSGQALDLLRLLRRDGRLDQPVRLGEDGPILRLVAVPVSRETGNQRRMKLKANTKGHKPSATLLALCDWTIFLTTLVDLAIGAQALFELYALRWRIECIFKTWKSHFSFAKLHQVGPHQVRAYLSARLLSLTLYYHQLYLPLSLRIAARSSQTLSLQKFTRYISLHPEQIPDLLPVDRLSAQLQRTLERYCSYDKRKRPNYDEELISISMHMNSLHIQA